MAKRNDAPIEPSSFHDVDAITPRDTFWIWLRPTGIPEPVWRAQPARQRSQPGTGAQHAGGHGLARQHSSQHHDATIRPGIRVPISGSRLGRELSTPAWTLWTVPVNKTLDFTMRCNFE